MHLAIIVPLFEFLVVASWKILLKIPHLLRSNPDVRVSPTYPLPLELLYRTYKCRKEKCVSVILNLLLGGWLAVSSRQLLLSSFRQKSVEEAGWTSEYCGRQKANITVPQSFQELCGHECFFFFAESPQCLLTSQRYLEHIYVKMCPYGIPGLLDIVWRNMCSTSKLS